MIRKTILIFSISLLGLGCNESQRKACDGTSEGCKPGFVCIEALCMPCVANAECGADPRYGANSLCTDGLCCLEGEQGCGCRANNTCDWTLACIDDLCLPCPPGELGCPCDAGACSGDSTCMNGVCADPSCVPGTSNCPCTADGECEAGRGCSPEGFCASCIPGAEGCICLGDGTCLDGLTCESGRCQDCQPGHQDCACLAAGGCEDPALSCLDGVCRLTERLCADLDCAAQGRLCEGEPYAGCTACDSASGYVPDGADNCIFEPDACASSADCQPGEYCIRLGINSAAFCSSPPYCTSLDAPAGSTGSAWDPGREACIDCPSCEGVGGSTSRIWPTTTDLGSCLCETLDGYYYDASISVSLPVVCDADGDGWVQFPARQFVESSDMALRENARCQVNRIDSFTLQNEGGEQRVVSLADMSVPDLSVPLYESLLTDDQIRLEADRFMPAFGERKLLAAELNPLTKACVTADADYNGNRIPDIQENPHSSSLESWMNVFWRMGYFVELHTGQFIPPGPGAEAGTYLIAEKPRCNLDFPLGYRDARGGYWRECSRRRAGDYDANLDAAGFDLAAWSCPGMLGSCPVVAPVNLTDGSVDPSSGRVVDATVDPSTGIPLHTSCSGAGPADPLASWAGMNHHSQFQCVAFLNTLSLPAVSHERDINELGSTGAYDANVCQVDPALDPGADGSRPVQVSCEVAEAPGQVETGDVGWAVALYQDHFVADDYTRGCINECRPFIDLCPTYHVDAEQNMAGCEPDLTNFGALVCNACTHTGQMCETDNMGVCAAGRWVCEQDIERCESIVPVEPGRLDPLGDQEDSNCDGFDGDAAAGVFVSVLGDDFFPGTPAEPKATLQHAVDFAAQRAIDEGREITVYADSGLGPFILDSPLVLADGVSILGGLVNQDHPDYAAYCPGGLSWCRPNEAAVVRTEIQMNAGVGIGIEATDIVQPTVLEFLDVQVLDASGLNANGNGRNAYGLRAQSSSSVVLRFVAFTVGNGAAGLSPIPHGSYAPPGVGGAELLRGGPGADYEGYPCAGEIPPEGPRGGDGCGAICGDGSSSCAGSMGGNPGVGNGTWGSYGRTGLSSNWAGSGDGGYGGERIGPGLGNWTPAEANVGKDGAGGQPGGVGNPGEIGFAQDGYAPTPGLAGIRGGHGGGGGGGAGGGGGRDGWGCDKSGGAGAAGGGGGCGGLGGWGSGAGGASIGVYLWASTIELDRCLISTGDGGAGGVATAGQAGGAGGEGGRIGDLGDHRGHDYGLNQGNGSNAAAGGGGGAGGQGGAGAAGPGGSTIGVFRGGGSATTITESVIRIGRAGANGTSPDAAGGILVPAIAEEEYND